MYINLYIIYIYIIQVPSWFNPRVTMFVAFSITSVLALTDTTSLKLKKCPCLHDPPTVRSPIVLHL